MRGFIGPSRVLRNKPLCCFWKDTQEWEDVSPAQIGYDCGFYDYADGTDGSAVSDADSTFARLEREFPVLRTAMSANNFEDWQDHKQFLLEFMQMLRARSPLGMRHFKVEARTVLGARVESVSEDRRTVTLDSLELRPLPERVVRNFHLSGILRDVAAGASWATQLDWCLRYTDDESEGFCTSDQAIFVEGALQLTDENGRMTVDLLRHPETLVYFPLSWQACLFGSPLRFDEAYDRARNVDVLRGRQKERADKFIVSPVLF